MSSGSTAANPLVAVHASGFSSSQFARLARDAAGRFEVTAVDLLGVGHTPLPRDRAYSLAAEVLSLVRRIEALGEPVMLFGHSFGGLVALEATLRAPERVRRLALFEPVIVALAAEHGSALSRAQVAEVRDPRDVSDEQWLEWFIDWWNGPGAWRALPEAARAQSLDSVASARRQAGAVLSSSVTLERLSACVVPTLFLTGDRSPAAALESAGLAAGAMRRAQLVAFPGLGHMGPLTHARLVNESVLSFFERPLPPG